MTVLFANNNGSASTSSTTYTTSLAATTPTVTATIAALGNALVTITASIAPTGGDDEGYVGFTISGTGGRDCTTVATCDAQALVRTHGSSSGTGRIQASATYIVTGLSAGSHVFTMVYRQVNGSATISNRTLVVQPLP